MSSEPEANDRVVTRLVGTGGAVLAKVTERVRLLRNVDDPGVLVPVGLGVRDGQQVVVRFPWLDGVDLAELETRRGPLSAGETVWLGVRVAQALESMHTQGIAHGDVSPSNIVIMGDQVVLVDTVAGCLADEYGTVGFRSPEREAKGATAAGDVYSLGALLRWCVADAERVAVEAWTAPLVATAAQARPPVSVARTALASCATPQVLSVPDRSELVTAVRARAADRTVRLDSGRGRRWRKVGLRLSLGVAVVAMLGAMVMAVPRLIDAAKPAGASAAQEPGSPTPIATSAPPGQHADDLAPAAADPGEAAITLTQQRFAALAEGDPDQLLATVGEGPLAAQVAPLATALAAGEVTYEGLSVLMGDVDVAAQLPHSAVVHVTYQVSDHVVTTPQGRQDVAAHTQNVELELSWNGQWTVQHARPIP